MIASQEGMQVDVVTTIVRAVTKVFMIIVHQYSNRVHTGTNAISNA